MHKSVNTGVRPHHAVNKLNTVDRSQTHEAVLVVNKPVLPV